MPYILRSKTMLHILLIPWKWHHNGTVKGYVHKYLQNNMTCHHFQILPANSTFHFLAKLLRLCGSHKNGIFKWGSQSKFGGLCPCGATPTWYGKLRGTHLAQGAQGHSPGTGSSGAPTWHRELRGTHLAQGNPGTLTWHRQPSKCRTEVPPMQERSF